jgi:hypothetical protein
MGMKGPFDKVESQTGSKKMLVMVADELYLVEVKTGSSRKDWGRSISSKLPPKQEIERARRMGFTPILIRVQLTEDWTSKISAVVL